MRSASTKWVHNEMQRSTLVQQPAAFTLLRQGAEKFATPLALTLGPTKGIVMNERGKGEPELLKDAASVAQRFLALPDRAENVGAMMLRSLVLDVHERYGDGAATAIVLARAMLREADKMLKAGANPVQMKRGVEQAVAITAQELAAQARPVEGQETLVAIATSITADPALGAVLGEMVDLLGEHVALVIEASNSRPLDHAYISGGQWDATLATRFLLPEGKAALELQNPVIAVIDEELKTAEQVMPLLELAVAFPDKPPLCIIAPEISDEALSLLLTNHVRGVLSIGMSTLASPKLTMTEDLDDIAVLTGAQVLSDVVGRSPRRVKSEFLGRARRVTLSRTSLVIADGGGEQRRVRQRIADIRSQLNQLSRTSENWQKLSIRKARLAGGIGVVKIGAASEQEFELKKAQIERVLRVFEAMRSEGVVPGGGVAYLACRTAIRERMQQCSQTDEAYGMEIVARALEAPFEQIVRNHGKIHPPVALMNVQQLGSEYGFDAQKGEYASLSELRILDSLCVARGALEMAASTASMAMTTDALVFLPEK